MVIQDGPAILGYERFREQEERSSYGIVQDIVGSVLEASTYELDEPMKQTFSRIFFGAMSAAGESVSSAEDPQQAVARIEAAIGFILEGLRQLAEQGVMLTDPAPHGSPSPTTERLITCRTRTDAAGLVGRDQLDPDVAGGHLQRTRGGAQLDRALLRLLLPGAVDDLALVEELAWPVPE